MIKQILITLICLGATQAATAQDIIYRKNGSSEKAKVKEISIRSITYKRWDNLTGPDFVIDKDEVRSVRFENGTEERFGRMEAFRKKVNADNDNESYGKNIISVAPIWLTNTSPVGVGLAYERMLGKNAIFSFYLPVMYSFDNASNSVYVSGNYNEAKSTMFWTYPGIKIYPTGGLGKVRYAIGVSAAIGVGNQWFTQSVYDPNTQTSRIVDINSSVNIFGMMITNAINIQPTPKITIGLEGALGFPYSIKFDDDSNSGNVYPPYNDYRGQPLVQFNFRVGYRF